MLQPSPGFSPVLRSSWFVGWFVPFNKGTFFSSARSNSLVVVVLLLLLLLLLLLFLSLSCLSFTRSFLFFLSYRFRVSTTIWLVDFGKVNKPKFHGKFLPGNIDLEKLFFVSSFFSVMRICVTFSSSFLKKIFSKGREEEKGEKRERNVKEAAADDKSYGDDEESPAPAPAPAAQSRTSGINLYLTLSSSCRFS